MAGSRWSTSFAQGVVAAGNLMSMLEATSTKGPLTLVSLTVVNFSTTAFRVGLQGTNAAVPAASTNQNGVPHGDWQVETQPPGNNVQGGRAFNWATGTAAPAAEFAGLWLRRGVIAGAVGAGVSWTWAPTRGPQANNWAAAGTQRRLQLVGIDAIGACEVTWEWESTW